MSLKNILILLAIAIASGFCFVGCGGNDDDNNNPPVIEGNPGMLILFSMTASPNETPYYYDPDAGTPVQLYTGWTSSVAWDKNHKTAAFSNYYDIFKVDPLLPDSLIRVTGDSTILESFPVFINGSASMVYTQEFGYSFRALCKQNLTTNAVDTIWTPASKAKNLRSSHDSQYLAYMHSSVSTSVYCVDTLGIQVALPALTVNYFAWANISDDMVIVSGDYMRIIDVPAGTFTQIDATAGSTIKYARFSPDDSKIGYSSDVGTYSELYISNTDGSEKRTLYTTAASTKIRAIGFSKDGTEMAVVTNTGVAYQILLIDVATAVATVKISECYRFINMEWY